MLRKESLTKKVIPGIYILLFIGIFAGTANAGNGLNARYYNDDNFYRWDWEAVGTPDALQIDPYIAFDWFGGSTLPSAIANDGWWSADWQGFISIPTTGTYTFATTSDDGSRVYIDDKIVVDNGGDHPPTYNPGTPVTLSAGMHPIKVKYFESNSGPAQIFLYWTVPGEIETIVPEKVLFTENPLISVSIATDKPVYSQGSKMIVSVEIKNPTTSSVAADVNVYIKSTDLGLNVKKVSKRLTMAPGFDKKITRTIPIGNLGQNNFNASWYIEMRETTAPFNLIGEASATWQYLPGVAAVAPEPQDIGNALAGQLS